MNPQDYAEVISLWKDVFSDDPLWNEPAAVIRRKLTVQPELFLLDLLMVALSQPFWLVLMGCEVGSIIWQSIRHISGEVSLVLSWLRPKKVWRSSDALR